jgi:hypothetical protein
MLYFSHEIENISQKKELFILEVNNKMQESQNNQIKDLTQSRMYNHSTLRMSELSPPQNQFTKSWEEFDPKVQKKATDAGKEKKGL